MGESRGSIAFFTSYRPPVPLDIFCCSVPALSRQSELHLTDGFSYNYNCQAIPPAALKTIIKRLRLAPESIIDDDVDSGQLTGLIFVSEREHNLETLHVALRFAANDEVKVFSLADIYGSDLFGGARLEDNGCIAGGYEVDGSTVDHYLVYVSTKEPVQERRSPWNVVYKTNLRTGETERLTPLGTFDLSPSVSPSGKKVAVASFQGKRWDGEIKDLKTNIYVMSLENPSLERKRVIENGGWPSWGSENTIFFHRKVRNIWGVFQYNLSTGETIRVTPEAFDAVTPAAIDETRVAVATIRQKSEFTDVRTETQYRHIEIFDMNAPEQPLQITQNTRAKADHFNPFVMHDGKYIGYHRCKSDILQVQNLFSGQREMEETRTTRICTSWRMLNSGRSGVARPAGAPERDHGLDPGYFAVYLMNVSDRSVVRVITSGYDLSGHVNHPVFSPDGRSLAVTADLAAVSADPMSLPTFLHSVRPYGDIFSVDIDPDDMEKNKDVERFVRVTHSRYENSTPAWTVFSTHDPHAQWNLLVMEDEYTPACPYAHPDGGESWHMTGQICIPKRHC
ncbi:hypothetical protein HU200_022996 [Digitaria exilis]|uniref:Uncharacterized protein n=1 Tax=Digitaria exilis TaxID=1010633 RepID=A0A835CD52_9POAL|nr:hypothetical protein HU200_022996 [Digitaria exilis]